MKNTLFVLAILISALRLPAQTNVPVRLALVSETDEVSIAADILTAELSNHKNLHFLERDEIEKAYREQGLSAGNKDYLKLGQVLGADGLLLLDVIRTPQATNLMARLIAVKPGVILTDGRFSWPLTNTTQNAELAQSVAVYLNSFLPKLSMQATDAIPISVVNLRSAVSSAEGAETERQLKLLTIQRLSQEKELFVLERQKMQLLGEEKALKTDDSAFWNGSYLLEGTVDQNGYSQEIVTINARLTPPKGGAPLLFEVNSSRTNFSEVVNQLAAKVIGLLKLNSSVSEWSAAEEAAQYFKEAQWALRWGILSEAQAAADSAWALGKRDMDCATVRVKAYEVTPDTGGYQKGEFTNPSSTNEVVQSAMEEAGANHIWGLILNEQNFGGTKVVQYVSAGKFPEPKSIDFAIRALGLYYEFSQTLPPDEPKADSAWYRLGIEDLTVVSQVLQHFHFVPESQRVAAEKLAELRALARLVAAKISKSPSVHGSYFVGDRVAVYDELYHFMEKPSIFGCETQWGCFWQERPEDGIALYRELMSSPVFCYLHEDLWFRPLERPRLVAWNENDRQRLAMVWDDFMRETDASTNVFMRMEGKALKLRDANDEKKAAVAVTNFFEALLENRCAFVTNNVAVLYLNWGINDLVDAIGGYKAEASGAIERIETLEGESLRKHCSEYLTKLSAKDAECQISLAEQGNAQKFEKQKKYLKENTSFDFQEFVQLFTFGFKDYSKAQALEIQPLIAAYKSNLVAQSQTASGIQKGQLMGAIAQVGLLEDNVSRVLNPPTPKPQQQARTQIPKPEPVTKIMEVPPTSNTNQEIVTNVLVVNKSLEIPLDSLIRLNGLETIYRSNVVITAHHWLEGRLLLNFQFSLADHQNGTGDGSAIAILDPATEHWDVINCPKEDILMETHFYHHSTLLHGELFNCDGGQIQKYDVQNQQWQALAVSDGNNYELFAINGHLYAAGKDMIFEILDGGKSSRILASARRNPPVSTLDTQDLGTPTLFEGPDHSLRVCTLSKIFAWTGDDWHEESAAPPASSQPEIFVDGVLFRQAGFLSAGYQNGVLFRRENGTYGTLDSQDEISCLANETNVAKLCLKGNQDNWSSYSRPSAKPIQVPKPFWKMPANLLPNLPAALRQSDLYLLEDNFAVHTIINERHEILQEKVIANDTYNAALLCFSHDIPLPQKLFLKFDAPNVKTPTWMFPTTNLLFFGGNSKGVWIVPVSQLDPAIAVQKQIPLVKNAQEEAQAKAAAEQVQKEKEQAHKDFMAQYDRNHNGIIDPDEKEAALANPAFIESELNTIDANNNGWLDTVELAYFDANNNKILEPMEQAGIEIVQRLLAERLLKKFDANNDGGLNRSEFNELMQSSPEANTRPMPGFSFQFPDDNHDGKIDLAELETFLQQQTRGGLRLRRIPGAMPFNQMRLDPNQLVDPRQMFKTAVEFYWQNPPSATNRPPFNGRMPSGFGVPPGIQNGQVP